MGVNHVMEAGFYASNFNVLCKNVYYVTVDCKFITVVGVDGGVELVSFSPPAWPRYYAVNLLLSEKCAHLALQLRILEKLTFFTINAAVLLAEGGVCVDIGP